MTYPRLLALATVLACGLSSPPAMAFPVNYGNSYVPAPSHGLFLAIPSMAVNGSAMGGWGYLDLGVAERLSVTVDSLYLNVPDVTHDFGTTFVGMGLSGRPAPWISLRLSPLVGLKSGAFGSHQVALRGYCDLHLPHGLTLYTMPAVYQGLEGAGGSFHFNASLEKSLTPAVSVALEVLSGTPSWQFGASTRLAVAPSLTLALGAYTLQASLRAPLVPSPTAPGLEPPTGVICLGYGW